MKVYVLIPLHVGSTLATPLDTVIAFPQLSVTTGGVGNTASSIQATLDAPAAGIVNVGAAIVYVKIQSCVDPSQLVQVNLSRSSLIKIVYVIFPLYSGCWH